MEYLKKLMEKKNAPQLILTILFVIYLVLGYKMPSNVAEMIDTNSGKLIVILVALVLFAYCNPILGIIGLIVAYEMIKRSSQTTGTAALASYYPTEEKKWSPFSAHHQFPYTLEQEMVSKMAPIQHTVSSDAPYVPILDNNYDATPISSSN
jgi:hypothetical protein